METLGTAENKTETESEMGRDTFYLAVQGDGVFEEANPAIHYLSSLGFEFHIEEGLAQLKEQKLTVSLSSIEQLVNIAKSLSATVRVRASRVIEIDF